MIIVPELKKVFILVPRTGSGSFYREIQRVYPKAMLLYRHMEADGVPQGYDRWERIGFVRHPLARLRSLHAFMKNFHGGEQIQTGKWAEDAERIRRQGSRSFEDWVLNNDEPWAISFDLNTGQDFWPLLSRRNPAPENRLSQFSYLRPDLGTTIWNFEYLAEHMADLGLDPGLRKNQTDQHEMKYSRAVDNHIQRYCAWDLQQGCRYV